jgi:hypothetical protein
MEQRSVTDEVDDAFSYANSHEVITKAKLKSGAKGW